jgi:hypothetical protein
VKSVPSSNGGSPSNPPVPKAVHHGPGIDPPYPGPLACAMDPCGAPAFPSKLGREPG